jgi:glyoxylase-like metal-dependent hydrolase (beta-lactamase superfamily II)
MIQLKKLIFNSFRVNTYILHDETGDTVIIDPSNYSGDENNALSSFISQNSLNPVLILNTHCHIDHVLGLRFLKNKYNIPFHAHESETDLLKNGPVMGDLFGFEVDPLPLPDRFVDDLETIRFGNSELLAIHVPGHSPGSLSYYSEKDGFVITGDALFAGSIGRTDLPGGNFDTLINNIRQKLFILPPETTIWPGHGDPSSIGNEKNHNPFFND